jgi:hypothetical protein
MFRGEQEVPQTITLEEAVPQITNPVPGFVNDLLGKEIANFEQLSSYAVANGNRTIQDLANETLGKIFYISQEFALGEHIQKEVPAFAKSGVVSMPESLAAHVVELKTALVQDVSELEKQEDIWRSSKSKTNRRFKARREANKLHNQVLLSRRSIKAIESEWSIGDELM